jgi:hypothetical protein
MTAIKPIVFPLQGGAATQLEVNILTFATSATTCQTYNRLLDKDGKQLMEWNYTLTEEEFAAWGADNSVVEEFVAADKGIELI